MKICLDARWILEESSGIGHYTLNLIRHLLDEDRENQYLILFLNEVIQRRSASIVQILQNERTHCRVLSQSPFSLSSQVSLPWILKQEKVDIYHSTNFMMPLALCGIKSIVTVHDLIPFLFPHFAPQSKKSRFYWVYRQMMKWIAGRADFIVVDSENSRNDLMTAFRGALPKTEVVTFGIDPSFLETANLGIKKRLGIEEKIILYVGRQDPYKNVLGLIEILRQLRHEDRKMHLVIAGSEDLRYPEVKEKITSLGLRNHVTLTGYLAQAELVSLYRESFCLVLPSLYEGFGLPVLEAYECGIPVVASRIASIPEVAGEGAILLDPKDTLLWVHALKKLLDDPGYYDKQVLNGREQLKKFSWKKTAVQVLGIYKRIHEGRHRT